MKKPIELHLNANSNITPEKREILIKMFGILAVKAMEDAPKVCAKRLKLERKTKP